MEYVVKSGDSLSKIARDVLGDMSLWPTIAELNNIREPYRIEIGQVLKLTPDKKPTVKPASSVPRVIEKGTTIVAEVPPGAGVSPYPRWVTFAFWGALAAGVSYFLFPPKSSGGARRRRRR